MRIVYHTFHTDMMFRSMKIVKTKMMRKKYMNILTHLMMVLRKVFLKRNPIAIVKINNLVKAPLLNSNLSTTSYEQIKYEKEGVRIPCCIKNGKCNIF
jgi:hypothetical protein